MITPRFFEGEPYGHALVWKWNRRNLEWVCETHDGITLKVKCRCRRSGRGKSKWIAETWLPNIVESTGNHYDNADQAQEECIRFLLRWRKANPQ